MRVSAGVESNGFFLIGAAKYMRCIQRAVVIADGYAFVVDIQYYAPSYVFLFDAGVFSACFCAAWRSATESIFPG